MGKIKLNNRFITTYAQTESLTSETKILVDRETGVNYLYHTAGYGGGLTVLADGEGKPIVTPLPPEG